MRILILSNFYPPARPGGYTQWCHEIVEQLAQRGHTLGVLTSRHERAKAPAGEHDIYRLLYLEGDLLYYRPLAFFATWKKQLQANLAALRQTVDRFAPDLIFVWGMWALSKSLPALAEQLLPGRVVYYLSDHWPAAADMHTTYWRAPARHRVMQPIKAALGALARWKLASMGSPALRFEHALCVSARLREVLLEAGTPLQAARIIHGGTDVERFRTGGMRASQPGHLRLLYAGQLAQHKGVHTAIEAMAQLVSMGHTDQVSLTVLGVGHPAYEAFLRAEVQRRQLSAQVSFRPAVTRAAMPAVLSHFDVLVFPSIYEEPLARITQEAMAAGLVVIGTTTGGTREIIQEAVTGLTFAPEDAGALAAQIGRLMADAGLRQRLQQAGQQAVQERFTLQRMAAEIEAYLLNCLAETAGGPAANPGCGAPPPRSHSTQVGQPAAR